MFVMVVPEKGDDHKGMKGLFDMFVFQYDDHRPFKGLFEMFVLQHDDHRWMKRLFDMLMSQDDDHKSVKRQYGHHRSLKRLPCLCFSTCLRWLFRRTVMSTGR